MRDDWRQAATSGDSAAIAHLLEGGIDVDCLDHYAQTALMLAARHGHGDVIAQLLAAGANKDITAKHKLSALMLAVINRHQDVARQLVDAGADTSLRSSGATSFASQTAADMAAHAGLTELAAYIAAAEKSAATDR